MQMSKRIHLALCLAVLLAVAGLPPLLALAQDEPPQPPPATDLPPQEPREVEAGRPADPRNLRQETGQTGAKNAVTPTPLKKFEPTDKIGADSAVSFPVDI